MSDQAETMIIETTPETFERDVIVRSKEVPVVVDFWAEWCQPCRLLGPLLEKLAREYGGRFVLVKANTERLPEYAAALGVTSIPAVFGLRDAQVVDGFVGLLSENEIRRFLERLMPSEAEGLAARASALEVGDPNAAERDYRRALELEPELPRARAGLGRVLLAQGQVEGAREQVTRLERRGFLEPEAEALKAELFVREHAQSAGTVESARAEVEARPGDGLARFHLAEALAAAGQHAEALEHCLALVEADRAGIGEQARQLMLAIFQLLPPESNLVNEYRRRLSLVL